MRETLNIAVIGGGAAGYFAATEAARRNPDAAVYLLEGGQRPLAKVLVSGGGRCNVTHAMFDPKDLVKQYPRGQKELRSAFARFQPEDTIDWFQSRGVPLKIEPDGRIFPCSNKSESIADCLKKAAADAGVKVRLGWRVAAVLREGSSFKVCPSKGDALLVDRVIITTGSSPIGHSIAASLGHRIVPCVPSLFTFQVKDPMIKDLMGIAFKEVDLNLSLIPGSHDKFNSRGPLLITHWGVSGPAVLRLSAFAARRLNECAYQANLRVNWCPQHSQATMEQRLVQLKGVQGKSQIVKCPVQDWPKRFWQRQLTLAGIEDRQIFQEISLKALRQLAQNLTAYDLKISGKGVFKDEFVTAGGVDLAEINFRSLESHLTRGLFFAGEILNVDGVTGGFNFQNAWTTAWLAAQNLS